MKALVVIDVQVALFELPLPLFRADEVLGNIERLIAHARERNIPVIYLQHNRPDGPFEKGKDTWAIHPRVSPRSSEVVIQKTEPDAFMQPELDAALRKLGIDEIYFCGLATEGCVDNTVRGAYNKGYKAHVFEDAHTTTDNPHLQAPVVVQYHNWLMQRFASLVKTSEGIA